MDEHSQLVSMLRRLTADDLPAAVPSRLGIK
jgi:hypothetical protein